MTAPHLPPGSIVGGKFTIQSELGRGALSVTYRAITAPNREVALRLFDPQSADAAATVDALRRLQAELDPDLHRFVAPIVEIGHDPGSGAPFAVAPFIATPSLAQLVELCPFEPADAAAVASNLGRALDALHARRLTHRALKPTNVFVGPAPGWTVRLTDIAPRLTPPRAGQHSAWLAPEQMDGSSASDGVAADVFTTGLLVLHSLIGGAGRPSLGTGVDASKYAGAWGVELPGSVDPVFRRALSANPVQRPASVGALARDLATALEPSKRRPVPVPPRIRPPPPAEDDPPTMRMAIPESPPHEDAPTTRMASIPEVPSFAAREDALMGPPSPEAFLPPPTAPEMGGPNDGLALAPPFPFPFPLPLPLPPPETPPGAAAFDLEAPEIARRSPKMAYIAGALGLLFVTGMALITASYWARGRSTQAATSSTATAVDRRAPPRNTDSAAPEPPASPATAPPPPPPPPPAPAPAPPASEAPTEVGDGPAPAASVALGADEGELTVLCEPLACELVMIDGKQMTVYPGPAALRKGMHGVGIFRPGYGGQWQQVSLRQGERKTLRFKLTLMGPALPPPKKTCGKFLQRCD